MTVLFFYTQEHFYLRSCSCSCTTCIVYVNLFKDRLFTIASFQKADAKVRTLSNIFQIIFEVFFIFFSSYSSSLLSKGRKKKKFFKVTRNTVLIRMSTCRCFRFKSGCKGKNFKLYTPNIFEVFFHFSFPRPTLLCKIVAKKRKMIGLLHRFLSECQINAALVLESGCKSRAFIYTSQI